MTRIRFKRSSNSRVVSDIGIKPIDDAIGSQNLQAQSLTPEINPADSKERDHSKNKTKASGLSLFLYRRKPKKINRDPPEQTKLNSNSQNPTSLQTDPNQLPTERTINQGTQTNIGRTQEHDNKPLKTNNSINQDSQRPSATTAKLNKVTNSTGSSSIGAASLTNKKLKRSTVADGTKVVRTVTKNAANKTVISTTLPPYEIEVSEVAGHLYIECPLCVLLVEFDSTPDLKTCDHRTCNECMQRYLKTEINHSRLNITCPVCSEQLLQSVIRDTLKDDKFFAKYESFMLRKVLAAEPDARWCPAPDCGYAVLANGCAGCPKLICARDGCNTAFCYHCKQEWHPNQTCTAASIQRRKRYLAMNASNISELNDESMETNVTGDKNTDTRKRDSSKSLKPEDIKECPVCSSSIIKMNDGSCNHMTCSICETEFCWLCMKEISDLHYFSPSGCTFWGKKPWSRKKKLLWRLGMLVGAPICIVFIAGIAVPAIVIGIPVWAARKLHTRLEKKQFSRYRKNAIVTGGVLLSFVVSPIISAMALAVGIPILLGYVYGVVPLSLCRSSGGCLSKNSSIEDISQQFQLNKDGPRFQANDVISIDTSTSQKLGNPSISGTSMYMSNISLETNSIGLTTNVEQDDKESASNAALAGSIVSNADDGNSTRALAGSIMSRDSGGYALVPVEIHSQQQRQSLSAIMNNEATNQHQTEGRLPKETDTDATVAALINILDNRLENGTHELAKSLNVK